MILLPKHLFRSLLALVLLIPLGSQAQTATETKIEAIDRVYTDALFATRDTYRKSIAKVLADADKIEVYLLDFEMQKAHVHLAIGWDQVGVGFFPIMPYGAKSKILKTKVLSDEESKKLVPVLRENVAVEKNHGGAFCHYPIHGVRLWAGKKLIFESSFCWECFNFYVPYPDQTAGWVGLTGRNLQDVMTELMPILAREIERFNKMKGKKK